MKKVKFLDAESEKVYLDECGIVNHCIYFSVDGNDYEKCEIKENGKYKKLKKEDFKNIDLLSKQEITVPSSGYGGIHTKIENKFKYRFGCNGVPNTLLENDEDFEKLYKLECYELPYNYTKELLYDYEISVGMLVYYEYGYGKAGTYKVIEVYPPNKDNKLCKIESIVTKEQHNVSCARYDPSTQYNGKSVYAANLYKVPYEKYQKRKNELDIFNEEKNELMLQPLVEKDGLIANVYWQCIENAAQYTVSLYKYVPRYDYKKKLYLLEEFIMERNVCRKTVCDLIGGGYIVKITAEDRNGNIIAMSRGIGLSPGDEYSTKYCFPKWFK